MGLRGSRPWTVPTGTGAMTDVESIPYHVCRKRTVTHSIYHGRERPSHMLPPG